MLYSIQETTGATPRALETQPVLSEHLHYYLDLFKELSEARDFDDMGNARPIKLTDFLCYAQLWQFTRLECQDIWESVRMIDRIWLRLYAERQKSRQESQK
jgi:hypothetical protein